MHIRNKASLLALSLMLSCAAWAGERGYFGFGMAVDSEGMFWNPTLRSITIKEVAPQSPAALAGILAGDTVLELAGKPVAGAKGKEMQAYIEKDIGESVQVKLRHPNGDTAVVTMVATARTWQK